MGQAISGQHRVRQLTRDRYPRRDLDGHHGPSLLAASEFAKAKGQYFTSCSPDACRTRWRGPATNEDVKARSRLAMAGVVATVAMMLAACSGDEPKPLTGSSLR